VCDLCFARITEVPAQVCPECNKPTITLFTHPGCQKPWGADGVLSCYVYRGPIKRLITSFKYTPHILDLKKIISRLFFEKLIQEEVFIGLLKQRLVAVPVPLSKNRERRRGYNHAAELAKALAEKFSLEYDDRVLIRVRDTKPQFNLKREERLKNVKGAFAVEKKHKSILRGRVILLVDDLSTSCATISECARVLKRNGAKKVFGITLARNFVEMEGSEPSSKDKPSNLLQA